MPLSPGSRLGSYEVIAPIGSGGPPPLVHAIRRELWRGLAEAQVRPRP